MSCFTVCCKFVEAAQQSIVYFTDVLFEFTKTNSKKVCIDDKGQVLAAYETLAEQNEMTRSWLNFMSYRMPMAFEVIPIPDQKYQQPQLFLIVCSETEKDKLLITSSYNIFKDTSWQKMGITLLDKDDALELFQGTKSVTQFITNVAKDGGQISTGEESPNFQIGSKCL